MADGSRDPPLEGAILGLSGPLNLCFGVRSKRDNSIPHNGTTHMRTIVKIL